MTSLAKHKCDLCGRSFMNYQPVRGSITVDNGTSIKLVGDVCRTCAEKVWNLIGINFSGPAVRKYQTA